MSYIPRLQTQYAEEIAPALKKQFEYTSAMQVPRIEKICLNQGLGKAVADRKMVDTAVEEMSTIAGQKAVPTLVDKGRFELQTPQGHAHRGARHACVASACTNSSIA